MENGQGDIFLPCLLPLHHAFVVSLFPVRCVFKALNVSPAMVPPLFSIISFILLFLLECGVCTSVGPSAVLLLLVPGYSIF